MPPHEKKGPVCLFRQESKVPCFSDFYQIVLKNPSSLDFVRGLGNLGMNDSRLQQLVTQSHDRSRVHKQRLPKLPSDALMGTPSSPKAVPTDNASAAERSSVEPERPCPPSCAENRTLLQRLYVQVMEEKDLLTQRVSRIYEDKLDADRIAAEIDSESKASMEAAKQLKLEIVREQQREVALKDTLKESAVAKDDLTKKLAKLEAEYQRRKHELQHMESELRALNWSSGAATAGGNMAQGGGDSHRNGFNDENVSVLFAPRPSTAEGARNASRRLLADPSRPVTMRYVGLAEDHTIDVMERVLDLHTSHPLLRALTAPPTFPAARQGASGAHSRCALRSYPCLETSRPRSLRPHTMQQCDRSRARSRAHSALLKSSSGVPCGNRRRAKVVRVTTCSPAARILSARDDPPHAWLKSVGVTQVFKLPPRTPPPPKAVVLAGIAGHAER